MLALVTAAAIIAAQTLPADLVDLLSKPVSCRTLAGSRSHWYPARQGDTLKVVNVVEPDVGRRFILVDRYDFDPARRTWHVILGADSPLEVVADAPPWTTKRWELAGRDERKAAVRVYYELVDATTFRRSFARERAPGDGDWMTTSTSLCALGDTAPLYR